MMGLESYLTGVSTPTHRAPRLYLLYWTQHFVPQLAAVLSQAYPSSVRKPYLTLRDKERRQSSTLGS